MVAMTILLYQDIILHYKIWNTTETFTMDCKWDHLKIQDGLQHD